MGTNSTKSTDILKHLQVWVGNESKAVVEGVPLTTLKYCSVNLKEAEPPFCEAPTVQTEGLESTSSSDSEPSSLVIYIIVGVVVVMMIMVIAVLTCLATVVLCKRRKVNSRQRR